eukprot:PLAT14029.1.p2 GENE.PLAT14029.1~~PLAT14029.1.p2  ORF type:complete len:677 (+),score=327.57 PLAT14029.1:41-2032(+)
MSEHLLACVPAARSSDPALRGAAARRMALLSRQLGSTTDGCESEGVEESKGCLEVSAVESEDCLFEFFTRDLPLAVKLIRFTLLQKRLQTGTMTAADLWEQQADKYGDAPFLLFEGVTYSWREIEAEANRVANWAIHTARLVCKDVVVVMMENRVEFISTILGLAKVGIVAAMINTSLMGRGLIHVTSTAKAKAVIVGRELLSSYDAVRSHADLAGLPFYLHGGGAVPDWASSLEAALLEVSTERPHFEVRAGLRPKDSMFYIYTSGTTGLPKAAKVTHARVLSGSKLAVIIQGLSPADRIYTVLPLYHSAGNLLGLWAAIGSGASLALRRRFSASAFWREVTETESTVIQYIGELCRYLLAAPASEYDAAHKLRYAIGNGLRPDIWEAFRARFAVPQIVEFYASTEGNFSFFNNTNKTGAVGFLPPFLHRASHVRIVKFDVAEEQPVRTADGRCIECEPGEPGEAIARIEDKPGRSFSGYTSNAATSKKILTDVFEPGDRYFRSGDLMRVDADGFVYFVDRIGDTFRWKGENVSTNEVAEALNDSIGVHSSNVYGVAVPGKDGRAGMAKMVVSDTFDLDALHAHMTAALPSYARPYFLRLSRDDTAHTTVTFKHRKVDLVKAGFDPAAVGDDELLFNDVSAGKFIPLTPDVYAKIIGGKMRM